MSQVEILLPRVVPLGGLRSMNVRRTIPQRKRTTIGAWCFIDHYGPNDVAATGGMDVAAHPHVGLQTVSWLFAGRIRHRDSAGNNAIVCPGELNLMTAGRGISHSERSTDDTQILHGVQLWVVLPSSALNAPRSLEHFVPKIFGVQDQWFAQVFLGSLLGVSSPITTFTELTGAELNLSPGITLAIDVPTRHEHGILVDNGSIEISEAGLGSQRVIKDQLAFVRAGVKRIHLTAGDEGARMLFIGGQPFTEEIYMWWNFIGRRHEDLVEASKDWAEQISLSQDKAGRPRDERPLAPAQGTVDGRFGMPFDEPEGPLPAPTMPNVRLMPRKNAL